MEIREIQEIINQKLGLDDIEIGARITQTYETLGEVYCLEIPRDLEVIEIVEYKKICEKIFDCPKEELSEDDLKDAYELYRAAYEINEKFVQYSHSPYLLKSEGHSFTSEDGEEFYILIKPKMLGDFYTYHKMVGYSDDIAIQLGIQMTKAMIEYSKPDIHVLHTDITPFNISVSSILGKNMTEGPVFQLTAFNKATQLSEGSVSLYTWILPSGHYTSPEALNDEKFNLLNDMYSLGSILQDYTEGIASQDECVTHGFPSIDESGGELLNVSADLMKVISKMTKKEPADRYQSLEEQLEAFENLL